MSCSSIFILGEAVRHPYVFYRTKKARNVSIITRFLCMSFPGIVFSRLVQTAPVGFDSPRMFYNQVACFTTPLTASQVRECLKKIEREILCRPEQAAAMMRCIVR